MKTLTIDLDQLAASYGIDVLVDARVKLEDRGWKLEITGEREAK